MSDIREEIEKKGLRVARLKVSNFQKIRAFEIEPKTNMIMIKGKNGAGKSSIINAIWSAMGGKGASPEQPIKHGEVKGSVILDLGAIIIEKRWSAKSGESLTIKSKDGETLKAPQRLLDEFVGKTTIDPGNFLLLDNKKQVEVLKKVLGLNFEELESERSKFYNDRTEKNTEAKRLRAHADSIEGDPDGPKEETSIQELTEKYDEATEKAADRETVERVIESGNTLKATLRDKMRVLDSQLKTCRDEYDSLETGMHRNVSKLESMPKVDLDPIKAKMATVEETNKTARNNALKDRTLKEARETEIEAETLDEKIEAIDEKKTKAIQEAKFPVDGLAFGEDGLTLNGVPFAQASQAERLTAAFAIACRANPHLKILAIKDGSLFDSESRAKLRELAEKEDVDLWLEIVTDTGDGSLEIVEGE